MDSFALSEENIQKLFGHEAAEDEDPKRLREYYFKSAVYDQVVADLPLRILVSHKGIGKSALFQIAMAEDRDQNDLPILIKPDDIVDIATEPDDFLKTIRRWKDGLLKIICSKSLASLGLDGDKLPSRIKRYGGRAVSLLVDSFKEAASKFDFEPGKRLVMDQFLKTHRINIYIDDLDRGWQGRRADVARISALLNAVRDIANDNAGISFRIALRSDVYYLVRTSDESTDKIEGSVVWFSWTNHEIFVLLVKRIETFFSREVDDERLLGMKQFDLASYLHPVMEDRFEGQGNWRDIPTYRVLMSLIRKRPRDLVKLCTLAAKNAHANGVHRIGTAHLRNIFEQYSQGRVQDCTF